MSRAGVAVAGGVELDLATRDDLANGLYRLGQKMEGANASPKLYAQSGLVPATGSLVLDMGSAPVGALWVPMYLTMCGTDDTTTVANATCAVYVGGDDGNLSLSNLLIPAPLVAVPSFTQLSGSDDLKLHPGDHIYIVVRGTPAVGAQVTAILRVSEIHPSTSAELNMLRG